MSDEAGFAFLLVGFTIAVAIVITLGRGCTNDQRKFILECIKAGKTVAECQSVRL